LPSILDLLGASSSGLPQGQGLNPYSPDPQQAGASGLSLGIPGIPHGPLLILAPPPLGGSNLLGTSGLPNLFGGSW
jgi:hypothetical protein